MDLPSVINPGALSISSNITLEQGEDLLSGSFTSGLGLRMKKQVLKELQKHYSSNPKKISTQSVRFIISIPLSSSSLKIKRCDLLGSLRGF